MAIRIQCKCGKSFNVAEQYAGRRTKCKNCGAEIVIPAAGDASAAQLEAAPQPPAPSLKLELKPVDQVPGPPALPSQESGAPGDLMLEVEPLRAEINPEAPPPAVEEEPLVAELAEAPPPGEPIVQALPVEPEPAVRARQTPGAQAGAGAKCPKCGEPAAPGAAVCSKCGASLRTAPPAGVAGKKPGRLAFLQPFRTRAVTCLKYAASLPAALFARTGGGKPRAGGFLESLQKRKQFLLVAAGVAALVIGLVIVGTVLIHKAHKKAELAALAKLAQKQAPPPRRAPKVEEKPRGPAEAEIPWSGFSDLSTLARDRILKTGGELLAFLEKSSKPAETLAEAGIPESESAACSYAGPEVAALNRFRILLYEAKPDSSGRQWAFFSDGSARLLPSAELPSALLQKTSAGWMTTADSALLENIAPKLRVENVRFSSLEVSLDGNRLDAVPYGGSSMFPTSAGAHDLTLKAASPTGDLTAALKVEFKPGIVYAYALPRYEDLPLIPVRQYGAALQGQSTLYTLVREGGAIKGLQSAGETVTFLDPDLRNSFSFSSDRPWIDARIVQGQLTIEGLDDKRIFVSKFVDRLEEGALKCKDDLVARFRKTPLGTLRSEELPNVEEAKALAISEGEEAKAPGQPQSGRPAPGGLLVTPGAPPALPEQLPPMTGRRRFMRRGPPGGAQRAMRRSGLPSEAEAGMENPGSAPAPGPAAPAPLALLFPTLAFQPSPDCQALTDLLASAAPDGIQQLLLRIHMEQEPAGEARSPAGRGRGRAVPGERGMGPRGAGPARSNAGPPSYGGPPSSRGLPVVVRPNMLPEIAPSLLYGAVAVYGDPSAPGALSSDYEKMHADSPGYPQLLLALARSGRGLALEQLRVAAEEAPERAAIALSMVDDPAARKALAEVLAGWSGQEVRKTVEAWPALAGPTCRITFVETLASANPGLFNDATALNALMNLEPYALERVLAARLKAEFAPPAPPAAPAAPAKEVAPAAPAEPGQPGGTPRGRLAGMRAARRTVMGRPKGAVQTKRGPPGSGTSGPPRESGAARESGPAGPAGPARPAAGPPPYWLVLAHFKNTAAVTQFMQVLNGNDLQKRQQAVAALAAVPDASVFQVLVEVLKTRDLSVRRAAAMALLETGESGVVPILDAAMDKDLLLPEIVEKAPTLAATAGPEPTAALLAKMLTCCLPEAKAPEAKPAGERGAGAPRGRRGPRGAMPPESVAPEKTAPESAAEQSPAVPILAALARVGHRSPAVDAAIESAWKSADPAVRVAACRASAQLVAGDTPAERSAALTALATKAIKDSNATVRAAGLDLLQGAEAQAAIPILEPVAKDGDPAVRAAVMNALGGLAGDDARISKLLADALNDPRAMVISAAARAAARRKDTALGPALVALLNQAPGQGSDKAAALPAIAEAAGMVQAQGASSSLILLLSNTQPTNVRVAAVRALGALKDPTTVPALVTAAQDQEPAVLTAAIAALGEFDSDDAIRGTLDTLKRGDLPAALRKQILSRLASHCAESGPYGDWVTSDSSLQPADLEFLASAASSTQADWRAGVITIARRYLSDARPDMRTSAANVLGKFADDASARAALLEEFGRDATGIGPGVAEALRQIRDPAMIERPLLIYYKELSDATVGAGALGAARPPAIRGVPGATGPAAGAAPPVPGPAKASVEENGVLRASIIEAVGKIGGDEAATALHRMALMDYSNNNEQLAANFVAALESAKSPESVHYLCDYAEYVIKAPYAINANSVSALAIAALGRIGQVRHGGLAAQTLLQLMQSPVSPPDIAAGAADALDEIKANAKPG